MKKYFYFLFLLTLVNCKTQNSITITYEDNFFQQHHKLLDSLVNNYDQIYGLNYKTLLIHKELPVRDNTRNGGTNTREARAEIGKIFFNQKTPKNKRRLINIINHELFHTIQPYIKDTILFKKPIKYKGISQEIYFIGYYKLKVLGTIGNYNLGILTNFIEEGAAELCALKITPRYTTQAKTYFEAGKLFQLLIKNKLISVKEIIDIKKGGDLKNLCTIILNKEASEQDLIEFAKIFMLIGSNKITAIQAYRKIIKLKN
jgi:hypothetical protein